MIVCISLRNWNRRGQECVEIVIRTRRKHHVFYPHLALLKGHKKLKSKYRNCVKTVNRGCSKSISRASSAVRHIEKM